MQFCPKCGGMMLPKQVEEGYVLVCNACGHAMKEAKLEEYRVVKPAERKEEVAVIEKEVKLALPTTQVECSKCGHQVVYWWMRQTRAGDEAATRFYRCVKCGHTWREYT